MAESKLSNLVLVVLESLFDFDEIIDRREVPALKVHPMVLGEHGEGLFPASVADMDFRPPHVVTEAMQIRLDHGVFGYETVDAELIPGLCRWMERRHGCRIDEAHFLRAPNILNSLAMAISLFSDPGDGIIIQPPVFFDFFDIIRENRRSLVTNPLRLVCNRYEMDFDDLEEKASVSSNKILMLCNPHNPVGRAWTKEELLKLGDICKCHNVLVVSDEIHGDLVLTGKRFIPFASLGE